MFSDTPKASFVIQYFGNFETLKQIIARLKGYGDPIEIIVHNDSVSEMKEIMALLDSKNDHVVVSNDIHEIRAYNHCVSMCSSNYVIILQDDDLPSSDREWLNDIIRVFEFDDRIGVIGMRAASRQRWLLPKELGGLLSKREIQELEPCTVPIVKIRHDKLSHGEKFYVLDSCNDALWAYQCWASAAPTALRREHFLSCGMFPLWLADVSKIANGIDQAISYAMWDHGYRAVFLWSRSNETYREGVGERLTHATDKKRMEKKKQIGQGMMKLWNHYGDKVAQFESIVSELNDVRNKVLPTITIESENQYFRGVDIDGWSENRTSVIITNSCSRKVEKVFLEIPGWHDVRQHNIRVSSSDVEIAELSINPGFYCLNFTFPDTPKWFQVDIESSRSFTLPDGRIRSFRILQNSNPESGVFQNISIGNSGLVS